jgi:hypothetical protein
MDLENVASVVPEEPYEYFFNVSHKLEWRGIHQQQKRAFG